jgi:dGTPase
MVDTIAATGTVALRAPEADALAAFRAFNYERIYLRPDSVTQADRAAHLITALTEHYIAHPEHLGDGSTVPPTDHEATVARAVRYVSGMTDRFAGRAAVELLGWDPAALPRSA